MRIVMWAAPISRASLEAAFAKIPNIEFTSVKNADETIAALPDADVLVAPVFNYTPAVANAVRASTKLKFIQLLTIGYDRMALDKPQSTVSVSSAGDSLAPAVGEHAVAMMLALSRRLHDAQANIPSAKWDGAYNTKMFTLEGKIVTIVGFGAIGQQAAKRLKAFDAHIIGISRTRPVSPLADEKLTINQLDSVLGHSDIVMISTPLTPQTKGMFDAARIARMQKGAILINIARGSIIDTNALTEALNSGHLGGAGLDVTDPEPLPPEHPLWKAPNLVLTPHVSAAGSAERLAGFAAENVAAFVRGEKPKALITL